jgi:hemerythrin
MGTFKWDKNLETGIGEIDRQHRELFRRIDGLELAIYEGKGRNELTTMINYLESYVTEHFDAEEQMMTEFFYPDSAKHFKEHVKFRELYEKIKKEFDEKGPDYYLALDVDKEIRKWWENHILITDMAYVPYVKRK